MAFRTSLTPAEGLARAKFQIAPALRKQAQSKSTQFQSTTNRDVVLSLEQNLRNFRADLEEIAAVPGIVQYARDQENDQSYDIVAEFNATIAAIDAAVTEIVNTFPSSNGFLLEKQRDVDNRVIPGTFPAAALSTLRTRLDAIVAAIAA